MVGGRLLIELVDSADVNTISLAHTRGMEPSKQRVGLLPPSAVQVYASALTAALHDVLGECLLGVYVHGSAVLGGWRPEKSDVDVLVVQDVVRGAEAAAAAALATLADCPGTGLEISGVDRHAVAVPSPPWPFSWHFGGSAADHPTPIMGPDHPGDPDLALHYAVTRAFGWAAHGPPPTQLIGHVAASDVLAALRRELTWAVAEAPAAYAVLNACRAWAYLRTGVLMSKVAGGRWVLDHEVASTAVVATALAVQLGQQTQAPLTDQDAAFVGDVLLQLNKVA